jgi:hypothetical protein
MLTDALRAFLGRIRDWGQVAPPTKVERSESHAWAREDVIDALGTHGVGARWSWLELGQGRFRHVARDIGMERRLASRGTVANVEREPTHREQ